MEPTRHRAVNDVNRFLRVKQGAARLVFREGAHLTGSTAMPLARRDVCNRIRRIPFPDSA